MSLIKCTECGGDVSDHAEACPHCGNPLTQKENFLDEPEAVTIQKTYKKWKTIKLVSWIVIFSGLLTAPADSNLGIGIILLGIIGLIVAKFGAWWSNG